MLALIAGLLLFLGIHSVGLFVPNWRRQIIARLGPLAWKGLYTLVAVLGLALIVYGYGQARLVPTWLWVPPVWTRHLAALLTLSAFILLVAAYVPGSHVKARVGHPMLLGVKLWAVAHLIANGTLADLLLFGSFLVWAVALFIVLRRHDRLAGVVRSGYVRRDAAVLVTGVVAWAAFALWLHEVIIGVSPFAAA